MNIKDRYNELIKTPLVERGIKAYIPKPSESDYNRGYIRRYFVQKTNDKGSPIYEVSQDDKSKYVTNPLYTVADIKWRIKGPKQVQYDDVGNVVDKSVSESNRIAIQFVGNAIPNLKLYLPNLLQFYKS
jgi:hypothetical protein